MLTPGGSSVTPAVYDTVGTPLRNHKEEERIFNNPMYGDREAQQYEVPLCSATPTKREVERLFENPVYGQPDPTDYEVPVASPQMRNFLLDSTTTSATSGNIYEEPHRPIQVSTNPIHTAIN